MSRNQPAAKKRRKGEMFAMINGKRADAHLHYPILDNPEADQMILAGYTDRLRRNGMPEEMIARMAARDGLPYTPPSGGLPPGGGGGGGPSSPGMAQGGMASGGYPMLGPTPWDSQKGALVPRSPRASGMIRSPIPGRTDKIPMKVPAGSYIFPADIPSALGQGNTLAGSSILDRMIKKGGGRSRSGMPGFHWMKTPYMPRGPRQAPHMAEGGEPEGPRPDVDIIAAGGEYVAMPEDVANVGHGDENAGHKVLDNFVLKVRRKNIETLKGLKPPKK